MNRGARRRERIGLGLVGVFSPLFPTSRASKGLRAR